MFVLTKLVQLGVFCFTQESVVRTLHNQVVCLTETEGCWSQAFGLKTYAAHLKWVPNLSKQRKQKERGWALHLTYNEPFVVMY